MSFGKKLRDLRRERKLTQNDLAELAGVSLKTIRNYEGGKSYPKHRDMYYLLAEYFGVNVNMFLVDSEIGGADTKGTYEDVAMMSAKELIDNARGLFAGGELSEVDKKAVFDSLQEAYFEAILEQRR